MTKYWLGKKRSEETKIKCSESNKGKHYSLKTEIKPGEKSIFWKGNKAGSSAIHSWISKILGRPYRCEKCKKVNKMIVYKSGLRTIRRNSIHWAHINHRYTRNIEEWMALCSKCHGKYDTERGMRIHKNKKD
jgi:hypothetical protein